MKLYAARLGAGLLSIALFALLSFPISTYVSAPLLARDNDICFVSIDDSGVTYLGSPDALALHTAVSNAAAGSTIKVAGTCAGVVGAQGSDQVVHLNKDVTIVGGYHQSDWLAQPDSEANPTMLDAQHSGRVAIIDNSASVTMRHLTLRNGLVGGTQFGGAILVNAGSELLLESPRWPSPTRHLSTWPQPPAQTGRSAAPATDIPSATSTTTASSPNSPGPVDPGWAWRGMRRIPVQTAPKP